MGVGCCAASAGISLQTLINVAPPPGMRGRVLGLFGMCIRGAPALGALAMGCAFAPLGLRLPVAIGAMVLLVCWLRIRRRAPRLARALERAPDPDARTPEAATGIQALIPKK